LRFLDLVVVDVEVGTALPLEVRGVIADEADSARGDTGEIGRKALLLVESDVGVVGRRAVEPEDPLKKFFHSSGYATAPESDAPIPPTAPPDGRRPPNAPMPPLEVPRETPKPAVVDSEVVRDGRLNGSEVAVANAAVDVLKEGRLGPNALSRSVVLRDVDKVSELRPEDVLLSEEVEEERGSEGVAEPAGGSGLCRLS
jgi:hypothetical protein